MTLVGSGTIGSVKGSLFIDQSNAQLTFVKTVVVGTNGLPVKTGLLAAGTYTVTFVSGVGAAFTPEPGAKSPKHQVGRTVHEHQEGMRQGHENVHGAGDCKSDAFRAF